jgi:ATP-dependent RNA helicase SUPV3L1/SUV3
LRKYGVRFGAYHIYLPGLLKPAPRTLAMQLWALKNDSAQGKSVEDLLHLAGSGRTSIPIDREIDPALYRTAGYRACGERAVRVDILERLADLIRPALAWREGASGPKPPGAVVGGGFTVFNGMTSLTGASGEDFASILRALGYRMDRRPKPPEPAPSVAMPLAETPSAETPSAAAPEPAAAEAANEAAEAGSNALLPDVTMSPEATAETGTDVPVESAADAGESRDAAPPETPAEASAEVAADIPIATSEPQTSVDAVVPADATQAEAAAAAAEPAEPAMIEVWLPGRAVRGEGPRRRPRHRRDARADVHAAPQSQAGDAGAPATVAASDAATSPSAQETPGGAPSREGRHSRHRRGRGGDQRHGDQRHGDQRYGERHGGERQRHGGAHGERHDRSQRDRDRSHGQRFERRERDKAPDPNSPFAKLAALKAQLEADAKERR